MNSPWWAFTPEENTYVQETHPVAPPLPTGAPVEVFAFAGARLKLRAYNALLQGQFRHSDLLYSEGGFESGVGRSMGWSGASNRFRLGVSVPRALAVARTALRNRLAVDPLGEHSDSEGVRALVKLYLQIRCGQC